MAEKYYSILTNRGKELEAQSSATGKPVIIKDFVVGDGNGQAVKPDPAQTKLVREVYRNAISALQVSPDQANQFFAQLVLPVGVGGFVVREVGLLTDAGELYSVANSAAIEKPENGVSVSLQYRLAVSETANIELKVATGDGLFLRIDKNLAEIAAKGEAAQKSSREAIGVLDATTSRKGLVQLSSVTNSSSEALAATPKAVKAAYDLANGKYTAQDATTAQKGIVQLSSATDSSSETLAATPKAVSGAVKALKDTLGTSAPKDVVTSLTDTTEGRVPVVGWMGMGVSNTGAGCPVSGGIDYVSEATGIWQTTNELTTGTFPPNTSHYGVMFRMRGSANDVSQLYFPGASVASGGNIYFRQYNAVSMKWGSWYKIYSEFSKPTAGDVGALPITGGTLTGLLTLSNPTPYIALRATGSDTRRYIMGFNSDGSSSFYVGKANPNSESCMLWNYTPGSGVEITADGKINVNSKGRISVFNTDGTFTPAAWTNFDARYLLADSASHAGFASGDATRPYMRHRDSNAVVELAKKGDAYTKAESDNGYMAKTGAYTKVESDGRFQPKGNYTPAGQAYTKAESDARYNLKNTATKTVNSMYSKDSSTGVMEVVMSNITVPNKTTVNVTFPAAFPNACVGVVITYDGAGHGAGDDSAIYVPSYSRTGCTLYGHNANGKFMLIAKGY